jgi:hypothetical protein
MIMQIPHDKQFVYRFKTPSDSVYGPRTIEWIAQCYLSNEDCECAPYSEHGRYGTTDWRHVRDWFRQMLPAPITSKQAERLKRLNVTFDSSLMTKVEAQQAIDRTEGALPPMKGQLAKIKRLKISIPSNATRQMVSDLIEAHSRRIYADDELKEAKRLAASLRRKGIAAKDSQSLSELEDLDYAQRDLSEAMKGAKRIGLALESYPNDCSKRINDFSCALFELQSQFDSAQATLDWLLHIGLLPKRPSRSQIKAALPYMFGRILEKSWRGDESDIKIFYEMALAEPSGHQSSKSVKQSFPSPKPIVGQKKTEVVGMFSRLSSFFGLK